MTPAHFENILDLCRPPDGYQFRVGVWLAYGVNMEMVADTLAPILTTSPGRDRVEQRRLAAYAGLDAKLVVLGCAAQLGPVTAFPWATFAPVGGRTQHAKGGVLQFAKPDSRKTITRSFVTSANLTRPSITQREVLACEEVGSRTARPTLAHDLIAAIGKLVPDLSAHDRPRVRTVLRDLRLGLPNSRPAGSIVHSLDAERPLLAPLVGAHPKRADRLVIVGPPFAGDTDDAALQLVPWVEPGTQVDVYTGVDAATGTTLDGARRPAFSRAIVDSLGKASGSAVQVWGVPSYSLEGPDDTEGRRRMLHAKVIAIVHDQSAIVMTGSANCTSRGLRGLNREMVMRQDWTLSDLDSWLDELEAIRFDGPVAAPRPRQEPSEIPENLVEVSARFRPRDKVRPRAGPWHGTLQLTLPDSSRGLRLLYRRTDIDIVEEQDFALYEREAWLTASRGGAPRRVPIPVEAPDSFWETGPDSDDDDDPEIVALLRWLRPTKPRAGTRRQAEAHSSAAKDDRYRIDPNQALTMVARYRGELRLRLAGELAEASELFPREVERQVADTFLTEEGVQATRLLASLSEALPEFDPAND